MVISTDQGAKFSTVRRAEQPHDEFNDEVITIQVSKRASNDNQKCD